MGLKKLIIIFVVLIFSAAYIIGGSEKISKYIEKKSAEKLEEPYLEKVFYFNINYSFWTGRNKRTLELIEKFNLRYPYSEKAEKVQYLKAKAYDAALEAKLAEKEYKNYIDRYPDGKKIKSARKRHKELKSFY